MSLLRKIGDVALNAARRVSSYESVRRRVKNFVNWVTGYVEPTQIGQVLDEVKEHVRRNYPPKQQFEMKKSASALKKFATQYVIEGREGGVRPKKTVVWQVVRMNIHLVTVWLESGLATPYAIQSFKNGDLSFVSC